MRSNGISALLISSRRDQYYLTGFTGEDSAILLNGRDVHVISDGRFDESINQECPWVRRWMRKGTLDAEIVTVCKTLNIRRLAVQPQHVTLASQSAWKKASKGLRIVHAPPIITKMRLIKEDEELRSMRKAIKVAEDAFLAMRKKIRVGDTELDLAARLEYEMKRRGASAAAFPTIVAEGPNAALPHAHPGKRKIKKGSAVLIDWGARVSGYCSDLTRIVFVGTIPPRIEAIFQVVLEAQKRAISAVRPGARMCDVDAVARDYIDKAGYGVAFNHGLGHGLGLDVHESPRLSWQSKEKLEVGSVVTVEPGIYLPGVGGVRIEDDVLVTKTKARVLSRLDKDLKSSLI